MLLKWTSWPRSNSSLAARHQSSSLPPQGMPAIVEKKAIRIVVGQQSAAVITKSGRVCRAALPDRNEPYSAANRAIGVIQAGDIDTVGPLGGARWLRRMPQMVTAGIG